MLIALIITTPVWPLAHQCSTGEFCSLPQIKGGINDHSCAFYLGYLAALNSSLCVSCVAFNLLARHNGKWGNQVCSAIICHELELQKHNARLPLTIYQQSKAGRFEMFSLLTDLGIHQSFLSGSFSWVDTFWFSRSSFANPDEEVAMSLLILIYKAFQKQCVFAKLWQKYGDTALNFNKQYTL